MRALELARKKIGDLIVVEDIVIQDIALTKESERAIEQKMVQEQEAAKAKYFQQRAQIDADTAVIKAKGEAESIRIRGEALKDNPVFVDLQIVDRWDGIPPQFIGSRGNMKLLRNAVDWATGREEDIAKRLGTGHDGSVIIARRQGVIIIACTLAPPLLVAATRAAVWWRRRRL